MDKLNLLPEEINELIVSYLSGNISAEESEVFHKWVNSSKENLKEFVKIRKTWLATAQVASGKCEDAKIALNIFNHKLNVRKGTIYISNHKFKQFLKIAAVLVGIIASSSFVTYLAVKGNPSVPSKMGNGVVSVSAPIGAKATTVLPDGTKVWLNAGSNLTYNINTYGSKNREVTLIGQGFFKVITNAQKPFVVTAKGLKIKALGTEFDVKAYPEEEIVETTLVKGIVKLEGGDKNKNSFTITMNPKQKVTYYTGQAQFETSEIKDPAKIDAEKLNSIKLKDLPTDAPSQPQISDIKQTDIYTSWKDDRWVFDGVEIGQLAILLERRYNVSIAFDSEELKHYKFTGTFQQETLEQILKVLKLTAPLRYTVGKGTVELMLDPELKIKYKKYMKS